MRGQKVYDKISGKKFQRTNIVAAKLGDKIIAPMQYSGTTDAPLFEYWFEQWLLPCLPEDTVIVMDNASFHKKEKLFKREFDGKNIEKTAEICYNENNHKLKNRKAVFLWNK